MAQKRSILRVVMSLTVMAMLVTAAQAQQRGRSMMYGSLLGYLQIEQVQTELKMTDEQKAKVREVTEKLMGEMKEQYAALGDIGDRTKMMAKRDELNNQLDQKARELLTGVMQEEQGMRLYQIRMWNQPVTDTLTHRYIVKRLEITEEQRNKLAEIAKAAAAKRSEFYGSMRDASQEQRQAIYEKYRKSRTEADEQAVGVLTTEQQASFKEMRGKEFRLQMRRGSRGRTTT